MDVQLSIDLDLQQYAERVLQTQLRLKRAFTAPNPIVQKPDGTRQAMSLNHGPRVFYEAPAGSVIVMNHQTGQIMAMASYPTFDNRWFSQDISGTKFRELFDIRIDTPDCGDEGQPECPLDPDRASLTNRAIQGQYNMGSAFKVFVAWSALHTGLIEGDDYITDSGTYKAETIEEDVCAAASSACGATRSAAASTGRASTAAQHAAVARRVERRVLLPLGRAVLRHPGTDHLLLQNELRNFGFAADTGIDLPYEFDGRLPDHETKADLVESGALAKNEEPRVLLGDVINLAIGQGLLAATPMQLAVGYGAFANGGYVMLPRVVEAIYQPNTPTSPTQPGFVDLSRAVVHERFAPAGRQIPMEFADPIVDGIRQNITGPGTAANSTTAEELFTSTGASRRRRRSPARPAPPRAGTPIRGTTRRSSRRSASTATGRRPWSRTSRRPASVRCGAAPIVKCLFLAMAGVTALDAVTVSEPLDPTMRWRPQALPPLTRPRRAWRARRAHGVSRPRGDRPPGRLIVRPRRFARSLHSAEFSLSSGCGRITLRWSTGGAGSTSARGALQEPLPPGPRQPSD